MKRAALLFTGATAEFAILQPQKFQPLMARLPTVNGWSGERAFAWAVREAPFVEVADADVEAAYYFRLKVMREHVIETGFDAAPFAFSECRYPTTEADPAKPQNPSNGTVGCLWGDAQGVINAASGHHLAEARWLRNATYHDSYLRYFFARPMRFANGTEATTTPPRIYTSWQTMALHRSLGVGGDLALAKALLPSLVANVEGWVREHRFDRCPTGACDCDAADEDPFATCNPGAPQCFHIEDGWDAMENSVSGGGCRPTISGAVYAEAAAVSAIADAVGETNVSETMARVAADIRDMYLATFWNDKGYFAVLKLNKTQYARDGTSFDEARDSNDWYDYDCGTLGPDAQRKNCSSDLWPCDALADAEELLGLSSPWFFGVVPYDETAKYEAAWKSLFDGFAGPHGLRTASLDVQGLCPSEASNYSAMVSCGCYNYSHSECAWNAPSWPYETSRVLTAMSDVLH